MDKGGRGVPRPHTGHCAIVCGFSSQVGPNSYFLRPALCYMYNVQCAVS